MDFYLNIAQLTYPNAQQRQWQWLQQQQVAALVSRSLTGNIAMGALWP